MDALIRKTELLTMPPDYTQSNSNPNPNPNPIPISQSQNNACTRHTCVVYLD